jgi:hypothetical protein
MIRFLNLVNALGLLRCTGCVVVKLHALLISGNEWSALRFGNIIAEERTPSRPTYWISYSDGPKGGVDKEILHKPGSLIRVFLLVSPHRLKYLNVRRRDMLFP